MTSDAPGHDNAWVNIEMELLLSKHGSKRPTRSVDNGGTEWVKMMVTAASPFISIGDLYLSERLLNLL